MGGVAGPGGAAGGTITGGVCASTYACMPARKPAGGGTVAGQGVWGVGDGTPAGAPTLRPRCLADIVARRNNCTVSEL